MAPYWEDDEMVIRYGETSCTHGTFPYSIPGDKTHLNAGGTQDVEQGNGIIEAR